MAIKKAKTDLSATNLRQALWETLQAVRANKLSPTKANSIASQSREIMRTIKVQAEIAKISGVKIPATLLDFKG